MFRIDNATLTFYSANSIKHEDNLLFLSQEAATELIKYLKPYRFQVFAEIKVEMEDYYVFKPNDKTTFLIDANYDRYNTYNTSNIMTYMIFEYSYNNEQPRSGGTFISVDVLSVFEKQYQMVYSEE